MFSSDWYLKLVKFLAGAFQGELEEAYGAGPVHMTG